MSKKWASSIRTCVYVEELIYLHKVREWLLAGHQESLLRVDKYFLCVASRLRTKQNLLSSLILCVIFESLPSLCNLIVT